MYQLYISSFKQTFSEQSRMLKQNRLVDTSTKVQLISCKTFGLKRRQLDIGNRERIKLRNIAYR